MELTASDVREIRFGTTRLRAGYDMGEVDQFLDLVEAAIDAYVADNVRLKDEAGALRSQVQQLQGRLEVAQSELSAALEAAEPVTINEPTEHDTASEHDTVIVDESTGSVIVAPLGDDVETTAENPVVALPAPETDQWSTMRKVRDDLRTLLSKQLKELDAVEIPGS